MHELLKTQVGGEPGLCDHIVGVTQGQLVGNNRAAAVGDVSEGPGVDYRRLALQRLDQVGHHRLVQQGHQRALHAQLRDGYRIAAAG